MAVWQRRWYFYHILIYPRERFVSVIDQFPGLKTSNVASSRGGIAFMTPQSNWIDIAEQASKEMDSAKLMVLVAKLCNAIDGEHEEKSRHHMTNEPQAI